MYRTPHPLLNADEVGRLAASSMIELGGHTLHHPVLSHLSLAEQRREIIGGALQLRSFSGKKPRLLLIPLVIRRVLHRIPAALSLRAGLLPVLLIIREVLRRVRMCGVFRVVWCVTGTA